MPVILASQISCSANPKYELPYYRDGKFENLYGQQTKSFLAYVKVRLRTKAEKWPTWVELTGSQKKPKAAEGNIKVYFINHSTFLLQHQGLNILTDPIFSERASPVQWAGPKRVSKPGIELNDLPKIHYVLISHNHYDHMDRATLETLIARDNPKIILGLGTGKILQSENIREMAWWDEIKEDNVQIAFTPAQHWSARGLFDRRETLWGSFVIKFEDAQIYFAGDTGYSPHFAEIHQRFGPMDLALIPVGAYAPREFMATHHVNPEEAIDAHMDLKSRFSLGMHWGTFQLTNESRLEPKERMHALLADRAIHNFIVPDNGNCFEREKATGYYRACLN